MWYRNDYTLRTEGCGTRVTKHVTSSVSPVIPFLAGSGIKRDAMTSLRHPKDLVESATPHEPEHSPRSAFVGQDWQSHRRVARKPKRMSVARLYKAV